MGAAVRADRPLGDRGLRDLGPAHGDVLDRPRPSCARCVRESHAAVRSRAPGREQTRSAAGALLGPGACSGSAEQRREHQVEGRRAFMFPRRSGPRCWRRWRRLRPLRRAVGRRRVPSSRRPRTPGKDQQARAPVPQRPRRATRGRHVSLFGRRVARQVRRAIGGWSVLGGLVVIGAGFNGASFLDFAHTINSRIMALLALAAIGCYAAALMLLCAPSPLPGSEIAGPAR